ncbi:MAG: sulfatase-like hydrolase/transferase [Thermoanaerobaculia bacterium]
MKRLFAAAAVFALLAGCRKNADRFPSAPVVLISIDTLRADHLPSYGYAGVSTPALDALRRDSVLFENAISHVPLTLPSHTTILTGLLPFRNGIRDNVGFTLRPEIETLPGLLRSSGYATGAAVSSVVLSRSTGIAAGFDSYDDSMESVAPGESIGEIQRSGFETEALAEKWLARQSEKPFFFFLHLYEPHTPYEPVEPFRSRYREQPYDGEIATADAIVGKFLSFLKDRGFYDRSVIVLLSDHGEGLGQHGEDEHGVLLYREELHVPLFLKLPGEHRRGETVGRPVGLVDVFPTVAQLVGVSPKTKLPGVSLLAREGPPDAEVYSETFYPRFHYGWSELASLSTGTTQYIHAPRDEFYDYRADPREAHDLAPSLPPGFRALRNALTSMDRPTQEPGTTDPERLKKLAALGYIGMSAAPADATNLPNPRDHIGEIGEMKAAVQLAQTRGVDASVAAMRALLAKNPKMSDLWSQLATTLHKAGRDREALQALREVDRLNPGSPFVLISFANMCLEMGDLTQAKSFAQKAVAAADTPATHVTLAHVLFVSRDLDGAEAEANAALRGNENRRLPRVVLALVKKARGDLPGALQILDSVKGGDGVPPMSGVEFQRGDIFVRMGRYPEAEAAFRQEIHDFPASLVAWRALAALLHDEGRSDDAAKVLDEMSRSSANPRAAAAASETRRMLFGGAR